MEDYKLGTIEASEQLIKDLYIDLRNKVNAWSKITYQTPQARMGYIGQHLVSAVTGYPGGKSGARGHDLLMENGKYGEIKTCTRVDQLGACRKCERAVASWEKQCGCGSKDIIRKDDSKWLIGIRHETEFSEILNAERYYFTLFEFEEINNIENDNIIVSIWEVNPRSKGFRYCMLDYYLNIRAKSKSKAPFNMWPHQFKFALTQPVLIYRSIIRGDGSIATVIFPTKGNQIAEELLPLPEYSSVKTIKVKNIKNILAKILPGEKIKEKSKKDLLNRLEKVRREKSIDNKKLCDEFADEVYLSVLTKQKKKIPSKVAEYYREL